MVRGDGGNISQGVRVWEGKGMPSAGKGEGSAGAQGAANPGSALAPGGHRAVLMVSLSFGDILLLLGMCCGTASTLRSPLCAVV